MAFSISGCNTSLGMRSGKIAYLNVKKDAQLVGVAVALYLQIGAHEVHLLAHGHDLAVFVEQPAQQFPQPHDDLRGVLRPAQADAPLVSGPACCRGSGGLTCRARAFISACRRLRCFSSMFLTQRLDAPLHVVELGAEAAHVSSLLVTGTKARKSCPFPPRPWPRDMRRMGADTVRATTKAKTMPVRQAIKPAPAAPPAPPNGAPRAQQLRGNAGHHRVGRILAAV